MQAKNQEAMPTGRGRLGFGLAMGLGLIAVVLGSGGGAAGAGSVVALAGMAQPAQGMSLAPVQDLAHPQRLDEGIDVQVPVELGAGLEAALAVHPSRMVILALDAAADDDAAIALAQERALSALGEGFAVSHRYSHVPALAGWLRSHALQRLDAVPGLIAVSLDPELHSLLDDSTKFIGSDALRRRGKIGTGVNVAVIDTGVDADNLDLKDAVVAQLCTLMPRDRCGEGANLAHDVDGHGSHVAGIVASRGKRAGYGVASGAGIIAVKFLEERATGAGSSMIDALNLLLGRDDVDVINMSLGSTLLFDGDCDNEDAYHRALSAAFGRLRDAGVVSVAASGNDSALSKLASPACIKSVVSVGAMDDAKREVASFTNRGANLDLLAPGVAIDSVSLRGGTETKSGTSMAAPHVAGAFAILMAEAPWAPPDLLEQILKENGQRPTIRLGGNEAPTIKVDSALAALDRIVPTATPEEPTATPLPPTATPEPASPTPTDAPPTATPTEAPPTATREPGIPSPQPSPIPTEVPVSAPIYLPALWKN
jgi:subtilisin family serine protease